MAPEFLEQATKVVLWHERRPERSKFHAEDTARTIQGSQSHFPYGFGYHSRKTTLGQRQYEKLYFNLIYYNFEGRSMFNATVLCSDGHWITVDAVSIMRNHRSRDDFRSWPGSAGYYRRFTPGMVGVCKPQTNLPKRGVGSQWGAEQEVAFYCDQAAAQFSTVIGIPGREPSTDFVDGRFMPSTRCNFLTVLRRLQPGEARL
ncbi:hypothetical protein K450DRAFT_274724 [Umbelopsis ramanniana AG]|uniref:Uncharacterized protein n=1 Tax=Umbelopsis ramanniana AG TaxID=1314678 RepID=A0AAD5E321_UMBRA|nr:uncharacterized protein K450DRAFT_274724 [Umbelopsis ramanniana AG]KAI8576486.1 hypothetical protein K450DRAFT_274724 [Umbelopsis ramanniana AG]